MIWICFLTFLLATALSEYSIWRHEVKGAPGKVWKRGWLLETCLVWGSTLLGLVGMMISNNSEGAPIRLFGVVLVLFLFNGLAKITLALLALIGRKTGKRRLFNVIAGVLIAIIGGVIIYSATIGRSHIRTEYVEVVSDKVTPQFDGFRIVVFSDVHTGLLIDRYEIAEQLVEQVNALNADIVINCGDIVNYQYGELDDRTLRILSGIKSKYGIYSVLGNHDMGIYIRDSITIPPATSVEAIVARQKSLGWNLLRDASEPITHNGDTITITGLEFPEELLRASHKRLTGKLDLTDAYSTIPADKFNITISHAPQAWRQITETGMGDLTLSGHVHSLQMKFKFGEKHQLSPAAWFYDEWSGRYEEDGHTLYINDGIGYAMIPLRIGTKPEVTLLELKSR